MNARQIIEELVALKDLKDEYERCKQRRAVAFKRDLDEVARVEELKAEYEHRKPLAWAAARAFLAVPEAEQVAWVGPLNQLMPNMIYQAWRKEYPSEAVGYRPLVLKDTP
jgi:hypothetical protein